MEDTTWGTAGNPSHPPMFKVILSPDLAGIIEVGTEYNVRVAKLLLKIK